MASKNISFLALFLTLNVIFFTLVSGCSTCPKPKPKPKPKPACPPPPHKIKPTPPTTPITPPTTPITPPITPPTTPITPPTTPTIPPKKPEKCPIDTLKLGVCANLLGGLLGAIIGTPPSKPCCSLIQGLADTEAALCLCTAIKANVLGINLNVPISISLLLSACEKEVPSGFKCT